MEVTESLDAGYNRGRPKALGEPLTEAAVLDTAAASWERCIRALLSAGCRFAAPKLRHNRCGCRIRAAPPSWRSEVVSTNSEVEAEGLGVGSLPTERL